MKDGTEYVGTDADCVSFINDGTYGIPGGGGDHDGEGRAGTLIRKIKEGNKVLFINTTQVERLTIEEIEV